MDGAFPDFIEKILGAEVLFAGSNVSYRSPSQGHLQFGWNGPLRQDERQVLLGDFPRYASPYVQAEFPSEMITIQLDGKSLELDWTIGRRIASSFV